MKAFVVNVFYNKVEEPQIKRVYEITEDGSAREIQKDAVLYQKIGTVVLVCENEYQIMDILINLVSDKIISFEIINEVDLDMNIVNTMETESEVVPGVIIFQTGI